MVKLLTIKRNDFFQWDTHSYFGVTYYENSEVQIVVFSKWNMLRGWKLSQRFIFYLSSTSCKYEFVKPRFFDFAIWWRYCENHQVYQFKSDYLWKVERLSIIVEHEFFLPCSSDVLLSEMFCLRFKKRI